jgi:hypothetical protein
MNTRHKPETIAKQIPDSIVLFRYLFPSIACGVYSKRINRLSIYVYSYKYIAFISLKIVTKYSWRSV